MHKISNCNHNIFKTLDSFTHSLIRYRSMYKISIFHNLWHEEIVSAQSQCWFSDLYHSDNAKTTEMRLHFSEHYRLSHNKGSVPMDTMDTLSLIDDESNSQFRIHSLIQNTYRPPRRLYLVQCHSNAQIDRLQSESLNHSLPKWTDSKRSISISVQWSIQNRKWKNGKTAKHENDLIHKSGMDRIATYLEDVQYYPHSHLSTPLFALQSAVVLWPWE